MSKVVFPFEPWPGAGLTKLSEARWQKYQRALKVQWEMKMYSERGFDMPLSELKSILRVSRNWPERNINPNVEYYVASAKVGVLFTKNNAMETTFYHRAGVYDWLRKHTQVSRQTVLIDLAVYGIKAQEVARNRGESEERYAARVMKVFAENSLPYVPEPSCKKRKQVEPMRLMPFDFWKDYRARTPKSLSETSEQAYRIAFNQGYIKIELVPDKDKKPMKTLFYPSRKTLPEVPWLIPAAMLPAFPKQKVFSPE